MKLETFFWKYCITYCPGNRNCPPIPCCCSSHEPGSWRWGFDPRGCTPCRASKRGSVSRGKRLWGKGRGGTGETDRNCTKTPDFGTLSISTRINHWIAFGKIGRPPKSPRSSTYGFEPDAGDLWLWENDDETSWKKKLYFCYVMACAQKSTFYL